MPIFPLLGRRRARVYGNSVVVPAAHPAASLPAAKRLSDNDPHGPVNGTAFPFGKSPGTVFDGASLLEKLIRNTSGHSQPPIAGMRIGQDNVAPDLPPAPPSVIPPVATSRSLIGGVTPGQRAILDQQVAANNGFIEGMRRSRGAGRRAPTIQDRAAGIIEKPVNLSDYDPVFARHPDNNLVVTPRGSFGMGSPPDVMAGRNFTPSPLGFGPRQLIPNIPVETQAEMKTRWHRQDQAAKGRAVVEPIGGMDTTPNDTLAAANKTVSDQTAAYDKAQLAMGEAAARGVAAPDWAVKTIAEERPTPTVEVVQTKNGVALKGTRGISTRDGEAMRSQARRNAQAANKLAIAERQSSPGFQAVQRQAQKSEMIRNLEARGVNPILARMQAEHMAGGGVGLSPMEAASGNPGLIEARLQQAAFAHQNAQNEAKMKHEAAMQGETLASGKDIAKMQAEASANANTANIQSREKIAELDAKTKLAIQQAQVEAGRPLTEAQIAKITAEVKQTEAATEAARAQAGVVSAAPWNNPLIAPENQGKYATSHAFEHGIMNPIARAELAKIYEESSPGLLSRHSKGSDAHREEFKKALIAAGYDVKSQNGQRIVDTFFNQPSWVHNAGRAVGNVLPLARFIH